MKIFRACAFATLVALGMVLIFSPIRVRAQAATQASKPSGAPAGNAENGKRVYTKYGCYECHGREGQGSTMTGPRLGPNPVPFEVFASYVRKPMREMPPYTTKVVSDQELADIYAFLKSVQPPPPVKSIPILK